jgi:adenylate cyclase
MTTTASAYLLLQSSRGSSRFPLADTDNWTIGRGRDNTIPLFDHCASRSHAMIQLIGGGKYYIFDLGSRNGTYVNGRRITLPCQLNDGAYISIGETILEFHAVAPLKPNFQEESTTARLRKRRLITSLVVNIRNYSLIRQQINEKILSEVVSKWFRQATEIMTAHGSLVDQYVGEGLLCLWIHQADAEIRQMAITEILAAFQTLQALQDMSESLNRELQLPSALRIGAAVNTGYAYVDESEEQSEGNYPLFQVIEDGISKTFALETAIREVGLDIALGEKAYGLTPYSGVLLPFKQYFLNVSGYEQPLLTYGGSFLGMVQFLEKVSVVFSE